MNFQAKVFDSLMDIFSESRAPSRLKTLRQSCFQRTALHGLVYIIPFGY